MRQSEKGWKRTFLARTGQEIGASLIVGIMNKVPTAPLLFAVIPVAYTRAPVVASLYQGFFVAVVAVVVIARNPSALPFIARRGFCPFREIRKIHFASAPYC